LNEATGLCTAGSFCISGASEATSSDSTIVYIAGGTITVGNIPCPAGFFCIEGVELPEACPDGTYSAAGSTEEGDCADCDAGHYCLNGTKAELSCPEGHYCDGGDSEPIPCPRGTYSEDLSLSKSVGCKNCPRGFFCREEGISQILNYLCSPGYYCEEKALQQNPCPAGTYRDSPGAGQLSDC